MKLRFLSLLLAICAISAAACSSTPTGRSVVSDAVAAMGGEKVKSVKTVSMKGGSGTRTRLQEQRAVTDPEEPGTLTNVIEIVDLAGNRASLDYQVKEGGFGQHRHEVLTTRGGKPVGIEYVDTRPVIATSPGGLFSWGTQNSPEIALHRNLVALMIEAAGAAGDTPADDRDFNGKKTKRTTVKSRNGDDISLYFDVQTKLPVGFETVDTEALDGDVPAQYLFDDYKAVDGVQLPHKITTKKNGKDYSSVHYTSAAINDPAAEKEFEIPDAASQEADTAIAAGSNDYSPVETSKIGEGVYLVEGLLPQQPARRVPRVARRRRSAVHRCAEQDARPDAERAVPRQADSVRRGDAPSFGSHRRRPRRGGGRATILVEKGHAPALQSLINDLHTHRPTRSKPPEVPP